MVDTPLGVGVPCVHNTTDVDRIFSLLSGGKMLKICANNTMKVTDFFFFVFKSRHNTYSNFFSVDPPVNSI